jgi:hypothetical protein
VTPHLPGHYKIDQLVNNFVSPNREHSECFRPGPRRPAFDQQRTTAQTYQVFLLQPYFANVGKRLVKTSSGRTQALVELTLADVRAIKDEDLISVRRN